MKIAEKYDNYDLHPSKRIPGYENQAWEGTQAVAAELKKRAEDILKGKKRR